MNARIQPLNPTTTDGQARKIFDGVKEKIGMVPNLYRIMGHSPAALEAYLAINEKLEGSILGPAVREKVALAVSQRNRCGYCLSAHAMIATQMAGVPEPEVALAREARGNDDHETALLALASQIVENRGWIADEVFDRMRGAGVTDGEFVEVVALVAALTFSNYTNHLARTPLDFPPAPDLPPEG
ncbi:MAG: carboxymuconolactone decarboxylase family protein [Candidatus Krumholzibacteriia bacterium]